MTLATEDVATQQLSLPEELLLMLLNEESGYFHQVPSWNLNCAVVGAVLAELSLRSRIFIAQAAAHYMDEVFPDPFTFDIDRYQPPRDEHLSPGYAPFGLGTHTCLGSRWMELQLAVNLLLLTHHFTIEVSPANYELRIKSLPSMSPGKKLKFVIAEQRRELSV